jgi:hypothetical protein
LNHLVKLQQISQHLHPRPALILEIKLRQAKVPRIHLSLHSQVNNRGPKQKTPKPKSPRINQRPRPALSLEIKLRQAKVAPTDPVVHCQIYSKNRGSKQKTPKPKLMRINTALIKRRESGASKK